MLRILNKYFHVVIKSADIDRWRATGKYILDQIDNIIDVDRTAPIGIACAKRFRRKTTTENVVDQMDCVIDID